MILQALVDYYELMAREGQMIKPGYRSAGIAFEINLSDTGELVCLVPLKSDEQWGSKIVERPRRLEVPKQIRRSREYLSNFLCDNSCYVIGISNNSIPERAWLCFDLFKRFHHKVLDNVNSVSARAVLRFLDDWEPELAVYNVHIMKHIEELTLGGNIVFSVSNRGYAHDDIAIRKAWEQYLSNEEETKIMQCSITGKEEPVEWVHPKIREVKGGILSGVSLVSFNTRASESYGHDKQKGLNAPISTYAAFAYTTALNYLLANMQHKLIYGETTVVFWAHTVHPIYCNIAEFLFNPITMESELKDGVSNSIQSTVTRIIDDLSIKFKDDDNSIDMDIPIYILGMVPNVARLSVRFFYALRFGQVIDNMIEHYKALEIERDPTDYEYLPLWKLIQETLPSTSKEKPVLPWLVGALMNSVIEGKPYPNLLFYNVIARIRAEHSVSRGKAAILKAYLLRKNPNKYREVLAPSLNEDWNSKAYILGRLFAVLEKVQWYAHPSIKATIKEKFFTSASTTPYLVFPHLLERTKFQIRKDRYGYKLQKMINNLLSKLGIKNNLFPHHLDLHEQGEFIIGYYQQVKALYHRKGEEKYDNTKQI